MSDESIIAVCPKCGARNRVPGTRWTDRLKCGKCRQPLDLQSLYPGRAVDVTDANFQQEVAEVKGPVLVDFTAPW